MRANAFYTNPRLAALLVLFIVLMGGMAFSGLARQEDPTMTERWARVNTFLPGATAERMESLVSEPLETALREIPEIKEIDINPFYVLPKGEGGMALDARIVI